MEGEKRKVIIADESLAALAPIFYDKHGFLQEDFTKIEIYSNEDWALSFVSFRVVDKI